MPRLSTIGMRLLNATNGGRRRMVDRGAAGWRWVMRKVARRGDVAGFAAPAPGGYADVEGAPTRQDTHGTLLSWFAHGELLALERARPAGLPRAASAPRAFDELCVGPGRKQSPEWLHALRTNKARWSIGFSNQEAAFQEVAFALAARNRPRRACFMPWRRRPAGRIRVRGLDSGLIAAGDSGWSRGY